MRVCVAVFLSASLTLGGCASIVNGQNQSVSVETTLEGRSLHSASCKLINDKGTWFITTPGSATVHRSYEDLSVYCEKDSHPLGSVSVKSETKPMAFGNILFGGLIGVGVDVSTGAAYDYPPLIAVVMGTTTAKSPQQVPASASAPASSSTPDGTAPTVFKSANEYSYPQGAMRGPKSN